MELYELFGRKRPAPQRERRKSPEHRDRVTQLVADYRKLKSTKGMTNQDALDNTFRQIVAITGPKRANELVGDQADIWKGRT